MPTDSGRCEAHGNSLCSRARKSAYCRGCPVGVCLVVRNDQYDDLDKEAYRILFDEVVETPGSLPIQSDESKSMRQEQHRIEGSDLK